MTFKDWLKNKVASEELYELHQLRVEMYNVYRWCGEFEQMCDAIAYIKEGSKRESIEHFRERMREKYSKLSKGVTPTNGTWPR